jgi:pseudaminic acid synthase
MFENYLNDHSSVMVVAELSANHNGDINIALDSIIAAKNAGADAIKLQTYKAKTMTIDSQKKDFVINSGSIWDGNSYFKLYDQAHTPWEWHEKLFKAAEKEGLLCFSTPFDKSSVDFLMTLNNPIFKIASFEITDIDLIEYIASKNKPIILSTGIATQSEIEEALDIIRGVNENKIILLQCTSSYPTPPNEANLIMIKDFERKYDVIPGLSDHTLGIEAPIVAVSLGARLIEKHFILDKSLGGPDATFSLDPKEFKKMVSGIRTAQKMLGKVDYSLSDLKMKSRNFARSLYIVKDVKKNELVTSENIRSIRPGFGLHPKHLKEVLGKRFKNNYKAGDRLSFSKLILK